jgi:hypothetical protein
MQPEKMDLIMSEYDEKTNPVVNTAEMADLVDEAVEEPVEE